MVTVDIPPLHNIGVALDDTTIAAGAAGIVPLTVVLHILSVTVKL